MHNNSGNSITIKEYEEIIEEIEEQPHWRAIADKEMDYADGNQLDSDLLKRQKELGIPPAVEDVIGPTLLSLQGYEAQTRTDFRVNADSEDEGGEEVAEALNFKLNQAERQSKADAACAKAFRAQIACGIGWVEVSRESNPFKFGIRCRAVHRNEIHWDMRAEEQDLSDARWLRRQKWMTADRAIAAFPKKADELAALAQSGSNWWADESGFIEGGDSTGLENVWAEGRPWTRQESRWYNRQNKELCITELWYRRWVSVQVIKTPNGRVVEYDEHNPAHFAAVNAGAAKLISATVSRLRLSYWAGPILLHDGESPYSHDHLPYVPFFGFTEDSTGTPYGYVRRMRYAQDNINSGIAKLRWGMSSMRSERTEGAVAMTDDQFRSQVSRPDADIVLSAQHMAQPGARFEVHRDFQLNAQHFQLLNDSRASIERATNITPSFQGRNSGATSGIQEQTQVEQANQSVATIMDNFKNARTQVGEILIALLIEDMGNEEQRVLIKGDAITEDREVILNRVDFDEYGRKLVNNDISKTRLKVALEDVPSSNSYRAQQLYAMTEAIKPLPQEYLAAAIPFLTQLMDVPFKRELIEAFRGVRETPSQEQVEQQIKQAVQQALKDAGNEIKQRELDIKERKAGSEIKEIESRAVQIGVQAAYAAMQAGAQVAQMPMIAPVADAVMKGAGYKKPTPAGDDPDFPVASKMVAMNIKSPYIQGQDNNAVEVADVGASRTNTSPQLPPVPEQGGRGIETARVEDNI